MKKLNSLSLLVLESIMTDCLMRMEGSTNIAYIEKQIKLFKEVENVLLNRRDDNK